MAPTVPPRCLSPAPYFTTPLKPGTATAPGGLDFIAMSFNPPTRPSTHPLILFNPNPDTPSTSTSTSTSTTSIEPSSGLLTPPISPAAEHDLLAPTPTHLHPHAHHSHLLPDRVAGLSCGGSCGGRGVPSVAPVVTIEPYIQNLKIGGLFLRAGDAEKLKLEKVGVAETYYGTLTRYTPVIAIIFSRRKTIKDVFELPSAFDNTRYHDGVTGIDTLHALGFSVCVDRGMIYLQDPEDTQYRSHKG